MNQVFSNGNPLSKFFIGSRGMLICALALGVAFSIASPLWAQRFRQIQPKLNEKDAKAMQRAVAKAVKNPAGLGADANTVTEYFTKYYFPMMTYFDPDNLAELGDRREDLFKLYIRATTNADTQAALSSLALKVASAISKGNYHPAVRYNGALILGNLDQQNAGGTRNNPTPPIPLPAATAALLELLEQDDFKGVKVSPSVQLGALIGLERHARFGIAPQHAQRVTKVALDLIAQENPPEEVTQDVHRWMKGRAASVLINQHREKLNAEIQATLDSLIANEDFELENRCFVAQLMKGIDYPQAGNIKYAAAVAALGSLSQDVMEAESELADDYQQEILGGGGFNQRRNIFGGGRGGRGDDQPKLERRQLLSRLKAIYAGGESLEEGAPDAAKSQIQALLDALEPARSAATDKNITELELAEAVIDAAENVDQVVQSWAQDAPPAEKPEADLAEAA